MYSFRKVLEINVSKHVKKINVKTSTEMSLHGYVIMVLHVCHVAFGCYSNGGCRG